MDFDEAKAVNEINKALVSHGRTPYPDDELLNVIDMIWDYYEENGLLELDSDDDEEEVTADEIISYVTRMLKKDKGANISVSDLPIIISAELDYEESLENL